MIPGVAALLVANGAVLLAARRLLEPLKTGKPAVDVLLFLLLRTLLISSVVLAAGFARILTPLGMGLVGGVGFGILVILKRPRPVRPPLPLPWHPWLIAAAILVLLKLLVQVWIFAPYAGDVVTYHLPKIAEWIRAGGFTRELGANARVTLPAGFELLDTWWVVFLHHDVLIEMAGVELLLIASAAVYALGREVGLTPSPALTGALLFAATPGLQVEATAALNDGAATAMTLATAALIVARAGLPLILLPLALGLGIKPTTAYAFPGLVLLAVLWRREPTLPPAPRKVALSVAVLALAVGAVWYVRNLLWYGNPIYPMGTELGRQVQQFGPSLASLGENLTTLVNVRIRDFFPVGALHTGNANWGAVVLACGLPALIDWMRDDSRIRRLALAGAVSTVCVLTLVTPDPWNMRFILFVPALPGLAAARAAAANRFLAPLVVLAALLCLTSSIRPSELSASDLRRLAGSGWRERSARPSRPAGMDEASVGCLGGNVSAYWLYDPDYSRGVVYFREATAAALVERMDREGLRTLVVSPDLTDGATLREAVESGALVEHSDAWGRTYRRVR
ncbi:MAG: hypothetical protein JO332_09495 [Planctomycetaceae bacterium]|nr:hypothetical protein [Planctomycetaceae bacterium]